MRAKIIWFSGSRKVLAVVRFMGLDFVGIAKCSPEDKFDLAIGSDLAEKRAKIKACEYAVKYYDKESAEAFKYGNECETKATDYYRKADILDRFLTYEKHHD